jgi:hypothetical protein
MQTAVSRTRVAGTAARSNRNGQAEALVDGYCNAGDELFVSEALKLVRAAASGTISAQQTKLVNNFHQPKVELSSFIRPSYSFQDNIGSFRRGYWCAALRHGGRSEWAHA